MLVNNDLMDSTQEGYYNKKFRLVIESNLNYIKKDLGTNKLLYTDEEKYVYNGNLYGFLKFKNVNSDIDMYWIIMRLSGFNSPSEFGKETKVFIKDYFTDKVNKVEKNNYLLIPSKTIINNLFTQYSIQNN